MYIPLKCRALATKVTNAARTLNPTLSAKKTTSAARTRRLQSVARATSAARTRQALKVASDIFISILKAYFIYADLPRTKLL